MQNMPDPSGQPIGRVRVDQSVRQPLLQALNPYNPAPRAKGSEARVRINQIMLKA